jgi:hypothetical protein
MVNSVDTSLTTQEAIMEPTYKGHEFEALKLEYETQIQLLRFLTNLDLRIIAGYITIQLVLGSWLLENPVTERVQIRGLLLIDFVVAVLAAILVRNTYLRRKEVVEVIKNLNDALGYNTPGVYLEDRAIHVPTTFRPWRGIYWTAITLGFIGIVLIMYGASVTPN